MSLKADNCVGIYTIWLAVTFVDTLTPTTKIQSPHHQAMQRFMS